MASSALPTGEFVRRTLIVLGLAALALILWQIAYALLLAFGGVLFAVFLRGLAGQLSELTRLGMRWSLALVGVALLGAIVLAAMTIGPWIASELGQLSETLSQAGSRLRGYLEEGAWGRPLLELMQERIQQGGTLFTTAANVLRSTVDAMLALVLIIFLGIYFAVSPRLYTEGLIGLVPKPRQARMREVLTTTGNALWMWLLGQLVVMAAVGLLTAIGLYAIGVPLALALGLIAGLLEFIPFLGPILAAIPVLLVALTVDPQTALYAGLFFLGIQQLESNVLSPLVERRAVSLPPVLLLVAAIAFTLIFGIIGAIFAAPLLVVVIVWVKMLYMQDALAERVAVPGKSD